MKVFRIAGFVVGVPVLVVFTLLWMLFPHNLSGVMLYIFGTAPEPPIPQHLDWTPALWVLLAVIIPPILYLVFETRDYQNDGFLSRFVCFSVRLYWQHVLAAALLMGASAIALFVALATLSSAAASSGRKSVEATGGGRQSEQFYGFMNSVTWLPQQIWGGVVLIWQLFVFVLVFFFNSASGSARAHSVLSIAIGCGLYLIWLSAIARQLWRDEFDR